mmetsp:Transcript_75105/g.150973  ORF Transcript_75105/g.150973 Transcript_75105/m.150973 type:complete len:295 (+) Transcript_75105:175-1059(+)|eukprot:CAMPEP_0171601520 /NCGR_PEP_ID=MMETSP0990-20121206/4946_1 /TAXON_ID=483369 /ORGANISM="non described non described, Strain CCMP2098" /LENGTH=294 /DNA_ID=CAMNT_0012163641 /DNA_START=140 /DNA_END=1024 /DNA_ORIENTATION=-
MASQIATQIAGCFGTTPAVGSPPNPKVSLSKMFKEPFTSSSLAKDLPRLAGRLSIDSNVTVHTAGCLKQDASSVSPTSVAKPEAVPLVPASTTAYPTADGAATSPTSRNLDKSEVAKVVLALTGLMDESTLEAAATACSTYDAQVSGGGVDAQVACLELLDMLGGDSSIVVRALKLVNQGVVLYALASLRELVPQGTDLLTKDVRGPWGWLIYIDVFESFRIRHVRREQSLDQWGDTTNHFEYEFEVSATLDCQLRDVHATWLRINEVQLAPTMESARRAELEMALGSGGRIIS